MATRQVMPLEEVESLTGLIPLPQVPLALRSGGEKRLVVAIDLEVHMPTCQLCDHGVFGYSPGCCEVNLLPANTFGCGVTVSWNRDRKSKYKHTQLTGGFTAIGFYKQESVCRAGR